MKYRIQETIDGNDESRFVVQYKFLWWWTTCSICWPRKASAEYHIKLQQTKEVKYHTVEQ